MSQQRNSSTNLIALARAAAIVAVCAWTATASAGLITSATVSGPGLGTGVVPAIINFDDNNDEVPGAGTDNNLLVPIKRFDNNDYIDIVFTVTSTDGTTEYKVFESVDNNTGAPWTQYLMVLGFGTGANFVQSGSGDGLDFDAPEYNTPPVSSAFPGLATNEDLLVWSGGIHGTGAESYEFRIDVPDLQSQTFTLRQFPVPVPEPAGFTLAALGLALVVGAKKLRGGKA